MSLQRSAAYVAAILVGSAPMLATAPAFAESATSEGAKAVSENLAPYFGQGAFDHGLISVTPKGDAYELRFDLQRIVDGFGFPKGVAQVGSYSLLVAPLPDDTWKVSAESFPNLTFQLPSNEGDLGFSLSVSGLTYEGVYAPKLAAFLRSTDRVAALELKWHTRNSEVAATISNVQGQLQGAGQTDGSVSAKHRETFGHFAETVSQTAAANSNGPAAAPLAVSFDMGPITHEGSIENLRTKEVRDLFAFFVAHPTKPELVAHQDELKDRILATFPLWKNVDATLKAEKVALNTPLGNLGAKSITQALHQTGLVPHAAMEIGFGIDELSVPAGLVPTWAKPLVPTALELDLKLQMNDLDKIAHAAVASIDLRPDQSPDFSKLAVLEAMAKGGEPKATITQGRISAPSLDLYFHGEMALAPQPTGTFTLEAEGLDKALARLQDAAKTNPDIQQAVLGLNVAKGLAKPGANGRSVWVIAYGADGAVSVNGKKMGSTAKP